MRMICVLAVAAASLAANDAAPRIDESRILPMDHPAIAYSTEDATDRIAQLQRRLLSGETKLVYREPFGYLLSLLKALDVPLSSQVLPFSKTSFQAVRIFPRIPRALYHSDDVSVGYVRGGDVLELVAADARQGAVFYTLDQVETSRTRLDRRSECVGCHLGAGTVGVPGLLVRSVFVERSGMPMRGPSFLTDHRSPLKQRWGGWYVSGEHGSQVHMGNLTLERGQSPAHADLAAKGNVVNLKPYFDVGAYPSPHSDLISLMMLEHQTRMTNLLIRLGYETRIAFHDAPAAKTLDDLPAVEGSKIEAATEELLRYMLFTDEALLEEPIRGTSGYADEFSARGPQDGEGRSLYQLDLEQRLLRHPCSYLIYSLLFDGLPAPAKNRLYHRLGEVLRGEDESPDFERLSAEDRTAIREILTDTKPDIAAYWQASRR